MSRRALVYAVTLGVVAVVCPLLAGCIGWAYPSVSVTPVVQVGPAPAEVRAFRVDVRDTPSSTPGDDRDRYVLSEAPLILGNCLSPQMKLAIDYGWMGNFLVLSCKSCTSHTMMVRLYRPGWQTVEVGSWGLPGEVDWKEAKDGMARERAVDDLVTTWERDTEGRMGALTDAVPTDAKVFRCLARGSATPAHREALLFAASEYERLAVQVSASGGDEAARARLAGKAKALHDRAAQ